MNRTRTSTEWCSERQPEGPVTPLTWRLSRDPERVIVTAVNGGYDADTVAGMAGNLAGALHGAAALPRRWRGDLEYREELTALAGGLLRLSGLDAHT